jgi:hypothetical protein
LQPKAKRISGKLIVLSFIICTKGRFDFKYGILSDWEFACDTLCKPTLYFDSYRLIESHIISASKQVIYEFPVVSDTDDVSSKYYE